MTSIKVTILGRTYPLKVADEDVDFMLDVARFVDHRFRTFKEELKNQSETTIMVLASLSLAEELFMERRRPTDVETPEKIWREAYQKIDRLLADIKRENPDI